jgi:predicted metalloprotease with PDZ domain
LRERVSSTGAHAPLGGIQREGWKLVYNDQPNEIDKAIEKLSKTADFSYSLGFTISEDGKLDDVLVGSPAYTSGIGPGMTLIAVNGKQWSPEDLRAALKAAQSSKESVDLLVENAEFFKTYSVAYYDGDRNPHLEPISGQPDLLSNLLKPLSK